MVIYIKNLFIFPCFVLLKSLVN